MLRFKLSALLLTIALIAVFLWIAVELEPYSRNDDRKKPNAYENTGRSVIPSRQ